jgi:hypothetical protein
LIGGDAVPDPPPEDTFGPSQGDTFGPPPDDAPPPPPDDAFDGPPDDTFTAPPGKLRQPAGLWCLFVTEMWERFSYYGMRAILILYLTEPLAGMQDAASTYQPGRGMDVAAAGQMYGWYTGLCYLLPIIGGLIADRLIGTHRSMLTGAFLIMLGHVTLAVSGFGGLDQSDAGMAVFVMGLALIVSWSASSTESTTRGATAASRSSTWGSTSARSSARSCAGRSGRPSGGTGASVPPRWACCWA